MIWGLWYARPIGVDTLYPELEPDIIEVYLSDFTTYRHEDRRLKLTAGTEEFDDLWSEIQELRFRRAFPALASSPTALPIWRPGIWPTC